MSLNYVPSVGLYRVYRGAYGSGFRVDAGKAATPNSKYAVELTPREKNNYWAADFRNSCDGWAILDDTARR